MQETLLISISRDELKQLIQEAVNDSNRIVEIHNTTADDKFVNIGDLTRIFKVSKTTINNWKNLGKIPYYKIGRLVYFKESEVIGSMKRINFSDRRPYGR